MNDEHDNSQTDQQAQEQIKRLEDAFPAYRIADEQHTPWHHKTAYYRNVKCAQLRTNTVTSSTAPCTTCGHYHLTTQLGEPLHPCPQCVANLATIAAEATDELTSLAGQTTFRTVSHTKQLNLLLEQINLLTEVVNRLIARDDKDNNTPQETSTP